MRLFLLSLSMVLITTSGFSQEREKQPYTNDQSVDLALSASGGKFSAAMSWSRLHGVALKKKFKVGYGLRLTSFAASNKYYTTAPAKYTSPVQNLGTIFSTTIEENIDTISTARASTNSLNVAIYLEYEINSRLDVGFNIDAAGFSFGPQKMFNVTSSSFDAGQAPLQTASPTKFNLLLTSDNDIGSLNSELYLRYMITTRIGLRAGYTFLFSEYRTERDLSFNNGKVVNDRYRYKAGMILLAISFQPF